MMNSPRLVQVEGKRVTLRVMKICFCDKTALSAWRRYDNRCFGTPVFGHSPSAGPLLPKAFPSQMLSCARGIEDFSLEGESLEDCDFTRWGLASPDDLHLLFSRKRRGLFAPRLIAHSVASEVPQSALLRIDRGVFAVSPELLFVQLACREDFVGLLLLGYELCGCYAVRRDIQGGLTQRHPLCSPASIARTMSASGSIRGKDVARRALPYLRVGSGSPMETRLVLLWCLPMKYGGYGLPFPELNKRLDLGRDGALLWGGKNAFDLVWEDAGLVVEYDGSDHDAPGARGRDSLRRDALVAAGYSPIIVTKEHLTSITSTFALSKVVAKKLGVYLRFRTPDFNEKHRRLWLRLFGYGRASVSRPC